MFRIWNFGISPLWLVKLGRGQEEEEPAGFWSSPLIRLESAPIMVGVKACSDGMEGDDSSIVTTTTTTAYMTACVCCTRGVAVAPPPRSHVLWFMVLWLFYCLCSANDSLIIHTHLVIHQFNVTKQSFQQEKGIRRIHKACLPAQVHLQPHGSFKALLSKFDI